MDRDVSQHQAESENEGHPKSARVTPGMAHGSRNLKELPRTYENIPTVPAEKATEK
jgi:hypothetical protein